LRLFNNFGEDFWRVLSFYFFWVLGLLKRQKKNVRNTNRPFGVQQPRVRVGEMFPCQLRALEKAASHGADFEGLASACEQP
jgi:hypothetical protein